MKTNPTTHQFIEEAVERLEKEFGSIILQTYDGGESISEQLESFFRKELSTIASKSEEERQVISEQRLTVNEKGERFFNGIPDYEYLKIDALKRIAEAIEALSQKESL